MKNKNKYFYVLDCSCDENEITRKMGVFKVEFYRINVNIIVND